MGWDNNAPTAGDYAWADAQKANSAASNLQDRLHEYDRRRAEAKKILDGWQVDSNYKMSKRATAEFLEDVLRALQILTED